MKLFTSPAAVVVETPAKLNLFLELLAKRSDGFHEIETLMAAISIYDRLYVTSLSAGQTQLICRWASGMEALSASRNGRPTFAGLDELPMGSDNIVWRAVERLRQRAGTDAGIAISLRKRIPSAAGLGGASSDAAAALVAANHLWRLNWTPRKLAEVAAEIGSDVPFFLESRQRGTGWAICRGRGERIEPLVGMPIWHFVVAYPPAGLSTPAVYRTCRVPPQPLSVSPLIETLRRGEPRLGAYLTNRLQPAARELSPWIDRLQSLFARTDCLGHQMSGSGSSYFGICRDARHARCVASRIRAANLGLTFQVKTVPFSHRIEPMALS